MRVRGAGQIEQHRKTDRHIDLGRRASVNVPHRVTKLLLDRLAGESSEKREIFVDRLRDHVEIESFCRLRLLEHEQREALRRRVRQPLVDGEPVALRL